MKVNSSRLRHLGARSIGESAGASHPTRGASGQTYQEISPGGNEDRVFHAIVDATFNERFDWRRPEG